MFNKLKDLYTHLRIIKIKYEADMKIKDALFSKSLNLVGLFRIKKKGLILAQMIA